MIHMTVQEMEQDVYMVIGPKVIRFNFVILKKSLLDLKEKELKNKMKHI